MKQSDPRFSKPKPQGAGFGERLAALVFLVWLAIGGLALWTLPEKVGVLGVAVPLALLALVYVQARRVRLMRQEADTLRAALNTMAAERKRRPVAEDLRPDMTPHAEQTSAAVDRNDHATADFAAEFEAAGSPEPEPEPTPAEEPAPTFASRRELVSAPQPALRASGQASLPFGSDQAPARPLAANDFILALNFPQDPDDTDGFRALRLALKNPQTSPLIQAAQDVLTLLSQYGLYMDDLCPDHPRPTLWRRFAEGERGGSVGGLGGVHDPKALSIALRALRDDPVFRDSTHHFLRRFDLMLVARAGDLDDAALVRLAETRTARAFMLLGRAVGIFD